MASYVSVPLFDTMPMRPSLQMFPGMMPTFALPGEMRPGQFGPTRRVAGRSFKKVIARIMSSVGMPSVMQTTSARPASAASMMASAAKGGGTKITDALASVWFTASCTVSKIGHSSCVVPPLPGVTPPTTFVPYAAACFAWNVPSRPVRPWTIRRVDLSISTAIRVIKATTKTRRTHEKDTLFSASLARQLHHLGRRVVHRVRGGEVHAAAVQQPFPFIHVRPFHADHDGHRHAELLHGGDDALREHVAPQDAAKDVDEHRLHLPIGHQDLERSADLLRVR